jgi:GNAT superfamily N-acetyltransferase
MPSENRIVIRSFRISDAEDVVRVHWEAVHKTAAKDYPQEILNDWSRPLGPERTQSFIERRNERDIIIIAEIGNEIVGFGTLLRDKNQVGAIYVCPKAGRKGVGGKLLAELEQVARMKGIKELSVESSLNAEAFYESHGYIREARGEHTLRSGRKMACVKMRHVL